MVFGRGERDHDSPNQYDLLLETPTIFLKNIMFGNLKIQDFEHLENFGSDGAEQPRRSGLRLVGKLEYGINIFQKHEIETFGTLEYEIVIIKNHETGIWIMGSLSIEKA